jgi:hypothetical protein
MDDPGHPRAAEEARHHGGPCALRIEQRHSGEHQGHRGHREQQVSQAPSPVIAAEVLAAPRLRRQRLSETCFTALPSLRSRYSR